MLTVLDRYELRNLSNDLYGNCCRVDLRVTGPDKKRDYATNHLKKAVRDTFTEYEGKATLSEYAKEEKLPEFKEHILGMIPRYVQDRRKKLRYRKLREAPKRKIRINPVVAGAAAGFAIPAFAGIYSLISKDPGPVDDIYSFLYNLREAAKEAVSADRLPAFTQPPPFLKKLLHEGLILTCVGTVIGAAWWMKPDLREIRQYAPLRKELKEMLES